MNNISIKSKLLIVILLPLLALITLAGMKVSELQAQVKRQTQLTEIMQVSVSASNLVHELQKERGASAGFLNSKGSKFGDVLPAQRKTTDEKSAELKAVLSLIDTKSLGEKFNSTLSGALEDLSALESKRKAISSLGLSGAEAVSYYTGMNGKFLGVTEQVINLSQDPSIIRDASAYLYFLQAKERSGIERAVGAMGFSGGWNSTLLDKFSGLIKVQETYISVFLAYANSGMSAFYQEKTKAPPFAKVQEYRDAAFKANPYGLQTSSSVDPAEWFQTITAKINTLKEIEDFLAQDVIHAAQLGADTAQQQMNTYIVVLGVLIVFVIVLSYKITKDLIRNIANTKDVLELLAQGVIDVKISGEDRKDEIGGMARSMVAFRQSLLEKLRLENEASLAEARAEEEKKKVMADLADSFDSKVGGLINAMAAASTELQSTAQAMRGIADETSQSSQSVAASSEEANANVSSVASAMEEMTASSQEISMQINKTRERSVDTSKNAGQANEMAENLDGLVSNIGEVVTAIRDISDQTNLLALNATIEAARAGEAGKGFAVVAEEVKKLATETGQKTDEIEERIGKIQNATKMTVESMQRIIRNVSEIDEAIAAVSSAAEEQNATNSEISRNVSEAAQGVGSVAQIITEVQKSAHETGSSADAVLGASNELAELSENLKSSVESFLTEIRQTGSNKTAVGQIQKKGQSKAA
ncbi:MAG: methyl-accepting chemotaxis protein [Rhodospirillales bacterium]|nr:nitrate- and nitrite sensing domain-containing protein [Saprospiraceae bacterium]MCB1681046.1 nitrate- and nitrite sensing domain-containing protein [Alphaproteobacteria bacterium]MCB9976620.1 methyl-accepting chemotaxis protein [Rhodospirillales bacterium]